MELSKEKKIILRMKDEEVSELLRIAGVRERTAHRSLKENHCSDQIQKMIGLSEPKEMLKKILAFHRFRSIAQERGVVIRDIHYHMCFAGPPGTAKTSFARLCGQVFKEENLLASGTSSEVGRADLVSQYEGETAKKVRKCFDKAKGGILFIDEAYSLLEDKEGLFGDEAIATIVQEMENRRDVIVILAGYPDKMEAFLNRNPGLQSRLAFTVNFPEYSVEELVQISALIARKNGFAISPDAEKKIRVIFETARKDPAFGNGRFARNLIESALLQRALNVSEIGDSTKLTNEDLFVLKANDFVLQQTVSDLTREKKTVIGF